MNTADLDFNRYVTCVLRPIVDATHDKAALAGWLTRQLDEWELEAERPEGEPIAPLVIDALEQNLAAIA